MRIVYISSSSIPSLTANSIHVMKMCQALNQEGYLAELLAPGLDNNAASSEERLWKHYGIKVPFRITWMPAGKRFRNCTYHIQAVWYARNSHADLIYARHLGAAAVSSLWGIPTIYEAHDLPRGKVGSIYFRAFLVGRGFRRLVVISQALKKLLWQRYPSLFPKETIVAPDGVDLERYDGLPSPADARLRLGFKPEQFTAGYTGHLYAGRGIEVVLNLAHRCRQVNFLVVGGNPASVAEQKRKVQEQKLANVQFIGFVNNEELPLYQAACEVLLMPYQHRVAASGGGDIAGFLSPMKMFEYMATGRLIISSDLPVLHEVLNERNAAWCTPEDEVAWQAALERAVANPGWRLGLGEQARRDVEQYSWRRRIHRVVGGLNLDR